MFKIRKLLSTTTTPKQPAQCSKITTRGKQCSLPALPGSDRCTLPSHQRQP